MAKVNRRGVFFSLTAVFIVLLFTLNIDTVGEKKSLETEISTERARVEFLNMEINDLESKYFSWITMVASRNALEAMSEYVVRQNSPIDLESNFRSVFTNGTLVGSGINLHKFPAVGPYMGNMSLDELVVNISRIYNSTGILIREMSVDVLSISQKDPWTVHVTVKIRYFLDDIGGIASWKGETVKEADISIAGMWFKAPNGANVIIKKDPALFVVDSYTPSCVSFEPVTKLYVCHTTFPHCDCAQSPSFLARIEGKDSINELKPTDLSSTCLDNCGDPVLRRNLGFGICRVTDTCNYINNP